MSLEFSTTSGFAEMNKVRSSWKTKEALGEAIFWLIFGLVSLGITSIRQSIPLIFFMSAYALHATKLSEWAGHRAEDRSQEIEKIEQDEVNACDTSNGTTDGF